MKICMMTDAWTPWWGGGQTHILEVSKKLVNQHGCIIDIIVPNFIDKNNKKYPGIEIIIEGRLCVVRLGTSYVFPNMMGRILFIKECLAFALSNKYDIYHSHCYSTSIVLPILKLLKRGKVIFTLHGLGTKMLGAGVLNNFKIFEVFNKFFVEKIKYDVLITVARKSLSENISTRNVFVIGNGVNLDDFNKIKPTKDKKNFILLWVGRMVPVKGLSLLISVFQKLTKKYPNIRLKLVGDGPERLSLESTARKLKLENKIFFTGGIFDHNERLIKEYKTSNALVLPSLASEGFPITIVEAMAAKLPVIASDIGDTDILVSSKNGYLVKPGDENDLYNKIQSLILSSSRIEMGNSGYQLVRSKFTWDIISNSIYDVYIKVLR